MLLMQPFEVQPDKQEETNKMLSFKISDKSLLLKRNELFLEKGLPALVKNGFVKSPFSTSWFGRNNLNDFTYQLCRVRAKSQLETLSVFITRGDNWIKIRLNIFEIKPMLDSIEQLNGLNGSRFDLPPNNLTSMQLRLDDYKAVPLFYMLFGKAHKVEPYFTERGFNRRIGELGQLIEDDMTNIDNFVKKWYKIHKPLVTTWEGHQYIE